MGFLSLYKFKKFSIAILFLILTLLIFNFELLNANEAIESNVGLVENDNKFDGKEDGNVLSEKTAEFEGSESSQAIGILHSSDFDSNTGDKDFDVKKNQENSQNSPTINLMNETPPSLELEGIQALDEDISSKLVDNKQILEMEDKDQTQTKQTSTPSQDQGSAFASNSGSTPSPSSGSVSGTDKAQSSKTDSTSMNVPVSASTIASGSESSSNSGLSSAYTSSSENLSASSQTGEDINLKSEPNHLESSSQDSKGIESSLNRIGFEDNKGTGQSDILSSAGVDSGSSSKYIGSSSSDSGLLLQTVPEASSNEVELQAIFKSSASKIPIIDSAYEDKRDNTDTEAQSSKDLDSSHRSQVDQEASIGSQTLYQGESEAEAEESDSKTSNSAVQVEESEFSSDIENNVEFPEDNSKATSMSDESGTIINSDIKVEDEKSKVQEDLNESDNIKKSQENAADNYISVSTQTTPVKINSGLNIRRRRNRRVMTRRGVSQLIKELNNSTMRKKTTFFKKLIGRMSDDDVNLISSLITREISKRGKGSVLKKTLTSNIPDRPLLGKDWIMREKLRKKQE